MPQNNHFEKPVKKLSDLLSENGMHIDHVKNVDTVTIGDTEEDEREYYTVSVVIEIPVEDCE